MTIQLRKDKNGQEYFSFSYTDPKTKKRVRYPKSEVPNFKTREEADRWARSQEAHISAMKHAALQRAAWRDAYHSWADLSDEFLRYKQKKAPNSWRRAASYIEKYVLPFFLNEKNANNANVWHNYFAEYKDWLGVQLQSYNERPLSISSQNHAINALNSFIDFLAQYNHISPEANRKCPLYEAHLLGARDVSDVYTPSEMEDVHKGLNEKNESFGDFFYVLSQTGMRFNELFSLPMSALFEGHIEGPVHDELLDKNLEYFGYLILESQIKPDPTSDSKTRKRNIDNTHTRGPLKGRKSINLKNSRIIPILDRKCWNILATRWMEMEKQHEKELFGSDPVNYLFFEDIETNRLRNALNSVCESLKIEKDFHCLRHTFSTELVGRTRSFYLAKSILGHRTEKEFERYCHIHEQMQLKAKQAKQKIRLV